LVLQDALVSLDPLRPIGAEVGEVLAHHGLAGSRRKRAERVLDVMRGVGIPDPEKRARQYAHELSGGLRQRALIASAIAAGPALIIADEPTTALDVAVQAQVLAVLRQRLESGVGVLLISHDLGVVSHIADRILVMHQGEVVDSGTVQELLVRPTHPYTRQLIAARPSSQSRGHRLTSARFTQEGGRGDSQSDAAFVVVRDLAPVRVPSTPEIVLQVEGLTKRYGNSKLLSRKKAPSSQPQGVAVMSEMVEDGEPSPARSTQHRVADAPYALDRVSFTVHRGEVVGIVGESGSGKTTCGNIVLGLLAPDSGDVAFLGRTWSGSGVTEASRRVLRPKMQAIPQDPLSSFDPRYTVAELLTQSLYSRQLTVHDRLSVSVDLLEKVGLSADFLARRPATLSGGQRQRVAIARALAPEPSLIVCDEPVSALDVYVQAQVLDLLLELQARLQLSLLFISHDLGVIRHVSDRVLVFKDGRIVEAGATESVFDTPSHDYTRSLLAETMPF
jgi:peptide/nickel transport system ATP-binding protein